MDRWRDEAAERAGNSKSGRTKNRHGLHNFETCANFEIYIEYLQHNYE
jgi:hypothetical protein